MESGIPALIFGAIMLLGASFLARSSITSYDQLGQQIKDIEARTEEQARTRLTVTGISLDPSQTLLSVQVQNTGSTSIGTWSAFDVLVSYYTTPTTRLDAWIPYTSGALVDNTWVVQSISPDTFEPGILDPGETATIEVQLNPAVATSTTNLFVLSTDTGVTVSAPFSGN